MRSMIVSGQYRPGERMPTWDVLGRQHKVSRTTLMRAVESLKQEGFVESCRGSGTFVAERPPHLSTYALVLPQSHTAMRWPAFLETLTREANAAAKGIGKIFETFEGIVRPSSSAVYGELVARVESHHFAGMIFVWPQAELADSPLLTFPGVRRAYIMAPEDFGPQVQPDYGAFVRRSVLRLADLGRRRIAVIDQPRKGDRFVRPIQESGLEIRHCWRLSYPPLPDSGALVPITELLFDGARNSCPDGLIVADESHVEQVLLGLSMAGMRVGEDVDVVAQCSYPLTKAKALPIHWLGFDARKMLQMALEFLESPPEAAEEPVCIYLPAEFEDELTNPQSVALEDPQRF
jgi:DNA-binding transcriptional regulator YhcF (GntR family)